MADNETPWWKGAVVYQVYIRSFADSNGDGYGDFKGLMGRLDYIASLGVDALWLSPVHPSPNRDWGYDVSDFETVHPDYGTLADFDALLAACHARGIKVLLDEVLCHTSDEHAWFQDSLARGAAIGLVCVGGAGARRHGAEQLAERIRRAGLGVPAGAAPALPSQIPTPAAQAQLAQRRCEEGGAGCSGSVARARRGRISVGRGERLSPRSVAR